MSPSLIFIIDKQQLDKHMKTHRVNQIDYQVQ